MCDKLQARIKGRVLSSLDRNPVVLAAIMTGTEVATFTDMNGYFSFELSTNNGEIVLLIQEARHRHLEVNVDIRHSNSPDINIILEHIDIVQVVDKLHPGFTLELRHREVVINPGLTASLEFMPNSLVNPQTLDVYNGPGQLLYSLYSSGNTPDFTSKALKQMVYVDSKGVEFSIQSYVICTMEVVGENGYPLDLRFGTPIALKITLKFDKNIVESDVSNLHLFVYSKTKSHWLDHGRVGITSIKHEDKEYGTYVTIQQTLREISPLWAVGFPVRISCYIKAFVTNIISSNQDLIGATLSIEQADSTLNRPTFYQYSDTTTPGVGVCLKAVCSVGGIIYASVSSFEGTHDEVAAVSPEMDYGIVMGDKEHIMFYETDQSKDKATKTPYYLTEEACHSAIKEDKTHFEFTSNTYSATKLAIPLPMLLPAPEDGFREKAQNEFCFVKVSVYDCAPFTDIKVLSYSSKKHKLLSMKTAVVTGTFTQEEIDLCQVSSVVPVRASCVEYICGSDIHVAVQSRNHKSDTTESGRGDSMDCRYWSSNTAIKTNDHPSQTMLSFHIPDEGTTLTGVYRSSSANLALLQCKSGKVEAPGNSMDPEAGVAVTFTCLF